METFAETPLGNLEAYLVDRVILVEYLEFRNDKWLFSLNNKLETEVCPYPLITSNYTTESNGNSNASLSKVWAYMNSLTKSDSNIFYISKFFAEKYMLETGKFKMKYSCGRSAAFFEEEVGYLKSFYNNLLGKKESSTVIENLPTPTARTTTSLDILKKREKNRLLQEFLSNTKVEKPVEIKMEEIICNYCKKLVSELVYSCTSCMTVFYCNDKCKEKDQRFHIRKCGKK